MNPSLPQTPQRCSESPRPADRPRRGAIGKAFIAYLLTGSVGVAVVVGIVAWMAGC